MSLLYFLLDKLDLWSLCNLFVKRLCNKVLISSIVIWIRFYFWPKYVSKVFLEFVSYFTKESHVFWKQQIVVSLVLSKPKCLISKHVIECLFSNRSESFEQVFCFLFKTVILFIVFAFDVLLVTSSFEVVIVMDLPKVS